MAFLRGRKLAFSLALSATVMTVAYTAGAQEEGGGYVFSNVTAQPATDPVADIPDPTRALVSYDYRWEGNTFPGYRNCTWIVYGSTGEEVGRAEMLYVGMENNQQDAFLEIPVTGDPVSAAASCASAPEENGPGSYDFSSIKVRPVSVRGQEMARLSFSATWSGSGRGGAARCVAEIFGESGRTIVTHEFNFLSVTASPQASERFMDIGLPSNTSEPVVDAAVGCNGF